MSNNGNRNNMDTTPETAYEIVRRKKRKWPAVLAICLAGAAAAIIIPVLFLRSKTVNLSEYVDVSYEGINGYAVPKGLVDTNGLYNALAGKEQDAAKLESYKNFADSVTAAVSGEKVSNGDKLEVNVTFDENLRNNTGYKVSGESFSVTAEGIDAGKSVNLFEDASIDITGISPEAMLRVENNSKDEYLSTLQFKADKEKVANGDTVSIKCEVTDDELADHGFTTTSLSAMYDVEGLSEYITEDDITGSITDKIREECKTLIETETADNTYRMIYKLTNNAEYLSVPNTETAEDIETADMHLLKRKAEAGQQGNPENYIIAVFKAKIKVQDKEETGYFAFTYPDSYVTADGQVKINSDTLKDTLQMNTDLNALLEANIKNREDTYDAETLTSKAEAKEKETLSESETDTSETDESPKESTEASKDNTEESRTTESSQAAN